MVFERNLFSSKQSNKQTKIWFGIKTWNICIKNCRNIFFAFIFQPVFSSFSSCGMMVNYRYFIENLEKNSSNYLEDHTIEAGDQVLQLVSQAQKVKELQWFQGNVKKEILIHFNVIWRRKKIWFIFIIKSIFVKQLSFAFQFSFVKQI